MGAQIEIMSFDTLGQYFADTMKVRRYLTSITSPMRPLHNLAKKRGESWILAMKYKKVIMFEKMVDKSALLMPDRANDCTIGIS